MSVVRFIGDVHGKFARYKKLIKKCDTSIQVGDMGVGFFRQDGSPDINPPYDTMSRGNHRFIRGNHDNPAVCARHDFWIPDGTYENGMFFLGGAVSIDRAWRTEGYSWWSDEECSYVDLNKYIEFYAQVKPNIVVSHECPESIANQIMAAFNKVKIDDASRTRQALEQMLYLHQPKLWVFGHWHHSINFMHGQTRFRCLNELEYEDIDLDLL